VAEVYPGLVAHSADGEVETVMYQFLPSMLLNEFQKQQRTIEMQAQEDDEATTDHRGAEAGSTVAKRAHGCAGEERRGAIGAHGEAAR
jgi:hypothetical protein